MSDRLIRDQIAYYRRRAPEYDRTSTPVGDPFEADTEQIRGHLRAFGPSGRVLELACGTGQWTGLLAESADELTAVDASPEMLTLNAEKVGDPRIRYVAADLFSIPADGSYDCVFFGFWLSHVPPRRLAAFWELLRGLLAPGGRVFFGGGGGGLGGGLGRPPARHRPSAAARRQRPPHRQGALDAVGAAGSAHTPRLGGRRTERRALLLGPRAAGRA